jgi:DNA-binding NarL/FixJ family response regulator
MKRSPATTLTPRRRPIRVLLVGDQEVVRTGLRLLIESHRGFTVVGETTEAAAAAAAAHERPDIILLDVPVETEDGLDVLPQLLAATRESRILILTGKRDAKTPQQALRLGAMGFIGKDQPADVLFRAIEKVHAGEVWVDRAVLATMLGVTTRGGDQRSANPEAAKIDTLTQRELEIVAVVGEGLKNKGIAERLSISEATVRHHLTSIYDKLAVSGRVELMIYAYQHGLSKLPPALSNRKASA